MNTVPKNQNHEMANTALNTAGFCRVMPSTREVSVNGFQLNFNSGAVAGARGIRRLAK